MRTTDGDRSLLADLADSPVMAILRGDDGAALVAPALALLRAGVRLVEVSLTTPGACRAIEQIAAQLPAGARVGAGTVLSVGDVADVAAAGAQFVVTPALAESVAESVRRGLPVAAGAFTPTEVHAARLAGAEVVKVFPASVLGAAYLRALRGPFPDVPLMAVGGVGLELASAFMRSGAAGVGVGGPLVGDALGGGDLDSLQRRAAAFLAAARGEASGGVPA
ncbi:MAG TPA: bifunctional 4-hydroxy-2-oxoglutarate aldolase/2-dehydro-3-deoxy-phosphogluconate aldolase [Actinomycetales bacterium]|nr:bifunctional 4-hydroxy-2-oxoglutarate aldolase/2-dehydro-3-deoxy-phosphogluconate aldolase [Actinomycetales bacterium]